MSKYANFAITVQMFVEGNYAEKIANGEVRVFWADDPPNESTPDNDRKFYDLLVAEGNERVEILSFTHLGEGYYVSDKGLGMGYLTSLAVEPTDSWRG